MPADLDLVISSGRPRVSGSAAVSSSRVPEFVTDEQGNLSRNPLLLL
jgi:hypothetical protein